MHNFYQDPFNFADVSMFFKKSVFFGNSNTFLPSNSMINVSEIS